MSSMVKVEALHKSFGKLQVLNNVDLEVATGEVVVMIGASGSGKTTLLRCINLLEVPERGRIFIEGEPMGLHQPDGSFRPLADSILDQRRAHIGMVFQRFNLFPHLTVLGNVMLGPLLVRKLPKAEARALAERQLEKVGLAEKLNVYPSKLSGGQQQRVAIARALAMEPKLMLFDEPTSALDPELRHEVLKVMRDLAEEGMTMIVVTHEMEFAAKVGSRLLFIDGGKIAHDGPPAELLSNPPSQRLKDFLQHVA